MESVKKIKFRGIRIDTGKWVYGYYRKYRRCHYINSQYNNKMWVKVIPRTVGQYVGKEDDNNKEIYENDIIMANYTTMARGLHLICFHNSMFGGLLVEYRNHKDKWDFFRRLICDKLYNIKVVGNKFETPVLLKEK